MKVAVFVDSADPSRRRFCYWLSYFREKGITPDLVSVPDLRDRLARTSERSLPRLDGYDLVIFNWDVVNGDYAFRADEGLEFIQNRGGAEIRRWAHKGVRVLIELQSAGARPLQEVYDALVGLGEVTVSVLPDDALPDAHAETTIIRNRRRRGHPIIRDLARPDEQLVTKYRPFAHDPLLNLNPGHISTFMRRPEVLAWGHFSSWRKGWIPLLFRPSSLSPLHQFRPVAVTRTFPSGGEIIVSTLRAANGGNHDLLDALCDASQNARHDVARFHAQSRRRAIATRVGLILVTWLVGVALVLPVTQWLAAWVDGQMSLAFKDVGRRLPDGVGRDAMRWLAKNFKMFDVSAIATMGALFGLSRWLWKRRERA